MKMPTWILVGNSNSKGHFVGRCMVPDGLPLVDLHTTSNHTFFPTVTHAWRWMTSTSWWHAKMSMNFKNTPCKAFRQTSSLPPRVHRNLLNMERCCKQNNQLPTKRRAELKDNVHHLIWPTHITPSSIQVLIIHFVQT
jgi:hypothetical protein